MPRTLSLEQTNNSQDGYSIKSLSIKYALSSFASAVAETVTYPLDIVKTRLQIQDELIRKDIQVKGAPPGGPKPVHHGMFSVGLSIAKHEGMLQLWAGITPAVYRHLVYTGSRLVFYEQFRDYFKHDKEFPLWKAILVGVSSGALAQFIASPTDLVKVIMQAEGKRKLEGLPPRFRNVNQAFVEIYKQGGVRGLWRGCVVNVQRAALVSLGDLATYDLVKRYFMNNFGFRDDYKVHTISSVCSGLLAAVMGTPSDVIKTRIMNQPVDSYGRGTIYKSSWHCTVLTYQHEGFRGLYKGFWPTWARMAPWSLTFWLTYEEIRKLCGLSGF